MLLRVCKASKALISKSFFLSESEEVFLISRQTTRIIIAGSKADLWHRFLFLFFASKLDFSDVKRLLPFLECILSYCIAFFLITSNLLRITNRSSVLQFGMLAEQEKIGIWKTQFYRILSPHEKRLRDCTAIRAASFSRLAFNFKVFKLKVFRFSFMQLFSLVEKWMVWRHFVLEIRSRFR